MVLLFGQLFSVSLKIIFYHFITPCILSDTYSISCLWKTGVYRIGIFIFTHIMKANKVNAMISVVLEVLLIFDIDLWCYVRSWGYVYGYADIHSIAF